MFGAEMVESSFKGTIKENYAFSKAWHVKKVEKYRLEQPIFLH
jgi:hypothetical protein